MLCDYLGKLFIDAFTYIDQIHAFTIENSAILIRSIQALNKRVI